LGIDSVSFPPLPPSSDGSLNENEKRVYRVLQEFFLDEVDTDEQAGILLCLDIPIYLLSDMYRYDLFPLFLLGEYDSGLFPELEARRKRGDRRILARILELFLWYMIGWVVNNAWIETREKMKKYVPKFDPSLLEE